MKKIILLAITLFYFNSYAGRNDDLFSHKAADSCQDDLSTQLASLLAPPGLNSVMDYFIMGIYLNALLIEPVYPGAVDPKIVERAHQELTRRQLIDMSLDIDEAIQKEKPNDSKITVYRGQALNVPRPKNGKMYEVGEILKFPQFLSTSPDRQLAASYEKGVLLQITVPAGKRALNVQKFMGLPSSSYELLFPRNSELNVTGVSEVNGVVVVSAEMI